MKHSDIRLRYQIPRPELSVDSMTMHDVYRFSEGYACEDIDGWMHIKHVASGKSRRVPLAAVMFADPPAVEQPKPAAPTPTVTTQAPQQQKPQQHQQHYGKHGGKR